MKGTIKRILPEKSFGFILSDDGEYFFHRSSCETSFDSLKEGDAVDFEPENSSKGPRAANVRRSR